MRLLLRLKRLLKLKRKKKKARMVEKRKIRRIWSYPVCRVTSAVFMTRIFSLISLREARTVSWNLLEWISTLPISRKRHPRNESRLKMLQRVKQAALMPTLSNRYGLTFVPLIDFLVRV